jgi:hypothetical protein
MSVQLLFSSLSAIGLSSLYLCGGKTGRHTDSVPQPFPRGGTLNTV